MAFERALPRLRELGVSMWVVSTADPEGSAELVERTSLSVPVGHSLPMVQTAEQLGLFYEERRGILHAASFLFDATGQLALAVTSTGAVGRLMPDELDRLLDFWRRKRQATHKE